MHPNDVDLPLKRKLYSLKHARMLEVTFPLTHIKGKWKRMQSWFLLFDKCYMLLACQDMCNIVDSSWGEILAYRLPWDPRLAMIWLHFVYHVWFTIVVMITYEAKATMVFMSITCFFVALLHCFVEDGSSCHRGSRTVALLHEGCMH